jgi:hypothetical protein
LPALDGDTALYMLNVVADDAGLADMAKGGGPRASLAATALAARKLGNGDWSASARTLATIDPERAALWREAAKRSADRSPAGQIALAVWLESQRGNLFPELDPGMSRGLKALLDTDLPSVRRERLTDWLLHGGERERALASVATALDELSPRDARALAALAQADRLYNRLLNWDVSGSATYARLLAETPAARRIREAGKRIRAAHGAH